MLTLGLSWGLRGTIAEVVGDDGGCLMGANHWEG